MSTFRTKLRVKEWKLPKCPVITNPPLPVPQFPDPPPFLSSPSFCPKCGLRMEGVMGYCCVQPQCPTGLGGAWSSINDTPITMWGSS